MGGPKFSIDISAEPTPVTVRDLTDLKLGTAPDFTATEGDGYSTASPLFLDSPQPGFRGGALSLFAPSAEDFMTGGNRSHNAEADYIAREIIKQVEATGREIAAGDVRDWVHQELTHYKGNGGAQRNGNVARSDWSEVIKSGVEHFSGRSRGIARVVETSEDMHQKIEDLIDQAFEDCGTGGLISISAEDMFRGLLRTRLRAEFSKILMNEWGSERLEDISELMKSAIVRDFEERAEKIISRELSPLST